MPTPHQTIDAILAAAGSTDDSATVITLYADHLEALLAADQAAALDCDEITPDDWSPEGHLDMIIARLAEAITDDFKNDAVDDMTNDLTEALNFLQFIKPILVMRQRMDAGERGIDLDDTIRGYYGTLCWAMEERCFDDSVPAARILRYIFAPSLRNADTFLRGCIRANQEDALLDEAEAIAEDETDQRFTPPSLRSPGWPACATPGRQRRTGSRRTSSSVRLAGSALRRSWRRPS